MDDLKVNGYTNQRDGEKRSQSRHSVLVMWNHSSKPSAHWFNWVLSGQSSSVRKNGLNSEEYFELVYVWTLKSSILLPRSSNKISYHIPHKPHEHIMSQIRVDTLRRIYFKLASSFCVIRTGDIITISSVNYFLLDCVQCCKRKPDWQHLWLCRKGHERQKNNVH